MQVIEAWYCERNQEARHDRYATRECNLGDGTMEHERCLILPGLTAADWTALVELVRAVVHAELLGCGDDVDLCGPTRSAFEDALGQVMTLTRALPAAIIAAAREGK